VPVDAEARVLAVAGTTVAVYLPTPRPEVVVYDDTGSKIASTPLAAPVTFTGALPPVTRAGDQITWWTGSAVLVFDNKLRYRYTLDSAGPLAPLGPAAMMAGQLLVPVASGLAVFTAADGKHQRTIPLAHPDGAGAIVPAISGTTVIEQRGATLVGFGP